MKKLSLAIFIFLTVLASCQKPPRVSLKYVDVEQELITVGATTASIQCDYNYVGYYFDEDGAHGLMKAKFNYGESEAEMTPVEMQVFDSAYLNKYLYVELTGLKENTTYFYYYEFDNGFNTMRTALNTFKTCSLSSTTSPTIKTMVTDIGINYAKVGGIISYDGGVPVLECGVCWSETENPTIGDNQMVAEVCTSTFSIVMSGLEANTTYHIRAYATNEYGIGYGEDKLVVTLGEDNNEWVDLGLPSGLLWAKRNVGAGSTEDLGNRFAWGETIPKDYDSWYDYKYCIVKDYVPYITKYCTDSTFGWNGLVDNLTTLLPEDDAATANWGIGARMPTSNEWTELFNHCPSIWTIQNGVSGKLFTGINGNSLFLPAGSNGEDRIDYWSSSLTTTVPQDACSCILSSNSSSLGFYCNRVIVQPVRPVHSPLWE